MPRIGRNVAWCVLCLWSAAAMADGRPADAGDARAAAFASMPAAPAPVDAGPTPGVMKQTPLPPPSRRVDAAHSNGAAAARPTAISSALTMGASLAIVLGLFLAAAWLLRKSGAGVVPLLPKEAVEVLGRTVLAGRQHLQLLRCGNKLLLVAVSPAGVETLTEITDPPEVDRLAGLCQQTRSDSASAAFRQVFQQFVQAKPVRRAGRKGAPPVDELDLANADIPELDDERQGRRHA